MLFALTYWNDEAHSHRFDGKWCSYENWLARVQKFFKPFHVFLACGTWSDPRFNRLPDVPMINSGAPCDAPYDWDRHQYACCALSAAMAYALNLDDWDYLVTLDTDALVGDVNLPALFEDFSRREATMMAPAWGKGISGPFVAWKRRGAATFAHHRLYPNLCDPDEPDRPVIPEDEMALMYKNGRWWNPWPQFPNLDLRTGPKECPIKQHWPFITHLSDCIAADFERILTPLAIPFP